MTGRREKVMQAAEKLVSRGKISQAIKEYRKLLRESPNDANMLNRIGDLYARQDNLAEAVALYQKIAETYGRDGFFVKAIAIYKKIIRLDPTQFEVYERLADLYHRQGLVSEARSQYMVLADYYQKHGDTSAIIEIHRKLADLEPRDPLPRVKLAELYLSQGLLEETIGEYQRIAEVMLDHDKVEEATKVYLRALDVDSGDLAFISEAVLRLREDGHYEAAARVFEAAIERNPEAAKLAERMREHAESDLSEAEVAPPPPELVGDSVDLAEVIGDAAEPGLSARVSEEELEAIEASSDLAGVEMTGNGAFVIDLEEESALEIDEVIEQEQEIDLGELESVGTESAAKAPTSDPMESIDKLAQSLGLGSAPATSGAVSEESVAGEATSEADVEAAVKEAPPQAPAADAGRTRLLELLAEAEVFGKYGLESKAVKRLEQALEIAPGHFEAHRRLVALHLRRGTEEDVIQSAQRMLERAEDGGGAGWEDALAALAAAGYAVEEGEVRRAGVTAAPRPAEPRAVPPDAESGLEWLEELATGEESKSDTLFEVEEEFFDLAAELEKEIASESAAVDGDGVTEAAPVGEESLRDIVDGFKKGVAEILSPEDYDTHYNLGIAYREMGLLDEAIGEFQLSAKDSGYLVDSCSMLGACFLEKGFPDLAIKWCKRGLEAPGINEEDSLALLYDLGSVHAASGDREAAYEVFVEIYGVNSHYRDVVARLEELRGG